ncbi:Microtubule-destabilizing protein 60 [Linum perenne]
MDSSIKKSRKPSTPAKEPPRLPQSKMSENSDPNVSRSSPMVDSKSGSKSKKPGQKITPNSSQTLALYSPRNKLKERKFVVAKKKNKRSESRKEGEKVCDFDSRVSAIDVAKLEKGAVGFDFDSDFANVGDELGEKLFRIGIFWNGSSEFDEGGRFGFDEASSFSSDGKEQQRAISAAAFRRSCSSSSPRYQRQVQIAFHPFVAVSVSDHLIENVVIAFVADESAIG